MDSLLTAMTTDNDESGGLRDIQFTQRLYVDQQIHSVQVLFISYLRQILNCNKYIRRRLKSIHQYLDFSILFKKWKCRTQDARLHIGCDFDKCIYFGMLSQTVAFSRQGRH